MNTFSHIHNHTNTFSHIHNHTNTFSHIHHHTNTFSHLRNHTDTFSQMLNHTNEYSSILTDNYTMIQSLYMIAQKNNLKSVPELFSAHWRTLLKSSATLAWERCAEFHNKHTVVTPPNFTFWPYHHTHEYNRRNVMSVALW
jgi:hypothetical protein